MAYNKIGNRNLDTFSMTEMRNVLRLSTSRNTDVFFSEKLNTSDDVTPMIIASRKETSANSNSQIRKDIIIAKIEMPKFKVRNSFKKRSFIPGLL